MGIKRWLWGISLWVGLLVFLWGDRPPVSSPHPAAARPALAGPRFIDPGGSPLAGASLRILCYASQTSTTVLKDQPATTGADGRPLQPISQPCPWLAALQHLYSQPGVSAGGRPAYDVYQTSWAAGTHTLAAAAGDVTLNPANRLVLFRVTGSLNWQPAPGTTNYLADLRAGLKAASEYLFDLTDGQAAIGPVQIFTDGREWERAGIRLLAANDVRPAAFVGGMVPARLGYATPAGKATIFAPGAIYLGRYWNGQDAFDAATGSWNLLDAYRTIGHEWGHYAFFLFDEYQKLMDDNGDDKVEQRESTYCLCINLPGQACASDASAMSYHYTATEFWHPNQGRPAACVGTLPAAGVPGSLGTDQWFVHGEEDWSTLTRWGAIQGVGSGFTLGAPQAGPAQLGLAGDLFGREPGYGLFMPAVFMPGAAPAPTAAVSVDVRLKDVVLTLPVLNALYPQVFLLQAPVTTAPAGILYQGSTQGARALPTSDLGEILLVGAAAADQLRVSVDRYNLAGTPGGRYVYPPNGSAALPLANGQVVELVPETWTPGLDIDYGLVGNQVMTLTLRLDSPQVLGQPPMAQICTPAAGNRCPASAAWRQTMQQTGARSWSATFTAVSGTHLPDYAWVLISAPGRGELIRSYQVAGGVGPAHMLGDAPMRDGAAMVDSVGPLSGGNSRVILMNAAEHAALLAPLPANVKGIVGQPLDVDILPPGVVTTPHAPLPVKVILTLFYSQAAVDRLGIDEANLRVLYFNRATGGWSVVSVLSSIDKISNWVSTDPCTQDGIYAIGWIGP